MVLKDIVWQRALDALNLIGSVRSDLPMRIEYARDEAFGDYALTVAMDKEWREHFAADKPEYRNPLRFAEDICGKFQELNGKDAFFDKVEIAGPGYINVTLSAKALLGFAATSLGQGENYGKTSGQKERKIIFEFVSANPTGPLNVVSARAAALGDSCCNLLEASGVQIIREYYVNDFGNQVNLLGESCLLRFLESNGARIKFSQKDAEGNVSYPTGPGLPFPAEGYHGEYLRQVTDEIVKKGLKTPKKAVISKLVKHSNSEEDGTAYLEQFGLASFANAFGIAATEYFLETHKKDLQRFNVRFDNFFRERTLHESGAVMQAAEAVAKYTEKKDGKLFFRSTVFGDDKDRVIVRDDGRPTYLLADIAYHKSKMDRGYSEIFNIWGPDHHGYIQRLAGAMQAMGFPKSAFRVFIAQQVNLLDEGRPVVMSKRTGQFITMQTLMDEIPVDVSRYFFVMRSFEAHLDFDLTEARDTSEKNPYYYVAYAHARIKSILRKAEERGFTASDLTAASATKHVQTLERRRLLLLVARLPEEVRDAALHLEPHRLITYLYTLASAVAKFYGPKENRVIEQEAEVASVLMGILLATAITLKNGLALLGMGAPERLVREEMSS